MPLLTTNEEEDELSRIEAEERRIDAQIAESERIRALKKEKAALQAKKAELLAKREKFGENLMPRMEYHFHIGDYPQPTQCNNSSANLRLKVVGSWRLGSGNAVSTRGILERDKEWPDFSRFGERALATRQRRDPQGRGLKSRWNKDQASCCFRKQWCCLCMS